MEFLHTFIIKTVTRYYINIYPVSHNYDGVSYGREKQIILPIHNTQILMAICDGKN